MKMRSIRLLLPGLMLLLFAAGPRADEDYETVLARQVQGHWRESADVWWDFAPDLVLKTNRDGQQQRYLGFRLNGRVSPPWLDLLYQEDGQVKMALGIAHLRDDRLVWVEGEHVDARRWAVTFGQLPGRPDTINQPKDSKAVVHVLVRPRQNPRW